MELLEPEAALKRQTLHCNPTLGARASTSGLVSPTSVQFKGEINDALPRKRHQKRHLEFCTAYLRSRGSGVRISPGAPPNPHNVLLLRCNQFDFLLPNS